MTAAHIPTRAGLVKIAGRIERLSRTRGVDNFVLTEADQSGMGLVAIAAGLVGASGQAISTAASAGDTSETADYLELVIDGTAIAGWVWRSPFKQGDEVEAAAYWDGSNFFLQGLRRGRDGVVALYPHCSRGRRRHNLNAVKWWAICLSTFLSILGLFIGFMIVRHPPSDSGMRELQVTSFWTAIGLATFFALMIFSLSRKWMPFVHVAENVFRTFGWPDPENIDLVKSSRRLREGNEPAEYGSFYFRYFPDGEARHRGSS